MAPANRDNDHIPLISHHYRVQNTLLHQQDPAYGTTARKYIAEIRKLAQHHHIRNILDYGCGKRDISRCLQGEFLVYDYDPAIPLFAKRPDPSEMVLCIDVLEHVEYECLENVLSDLARLTLRIGFFTVATGPSSKVLPDGTNCHRIVRDAVWWRSRLCEHWHRVEIETIPGGLKVVILDGG